MELLGKGKEKQTVQIHVKAQHSKITHQTFHEVNNHKINRAAKCHSSSHLKRLDQCSKQFTTQLIISSGACNMTPHLHFIWPVSTRHPLKNFMHEPKNVKKRNCINKYISVILTNTLPTAKQSKALYRLNL